LREQFIEAHTHVPVEAVEETAPSIDERVGLADQDWDTADPRVFRSTVAAFEPIVPFEQRVSTARADDEIAKSHRARGYYAAPRDDFVGIAGRRGGIEARLALG
jgi:hypothetical protein